MVVALLVEADGADTEKSSVGAVAARGPQEYGRSMSVDAIRAAYEAANAGDVEPLVSLIHPQLEWRGRRRLSRFWRPPPY
jgi:hypothetical protein